MGSRPKEANRSRTRLLIVRVEPDPDPNAGVQTAGYVLDESIADAVRPTHPGPLKKMAPLSTRGSVLSDQLRRRLREYKGDVPVAIVIEPVRETLPPDRYYEDLLIEILRARLFVEVPVPICCITLLVHRPDLLPSLTSYQMLTERALENDCAICGLVELQAPESEVATERSYLEFSVVSPGSCHLESGQILDVPVSSPTTTPGEFAPLELVAEIRRNASLELGHFELSATTKHFPLLLDAHRLSASPTVVRGLRGLISQLVGGQPHLVDALEVDGSGLRDSLCPAIADGDPDRLVQAGDISGPVVVVSDFRSALHDEQGHAERLLARGASSVTILGIVDSADPRPDGLSSYGLISLDVRSCDEGPTSCRYCAAGVRLHCGSHLGELTGALTDYEPEVFWDMLALVPSFLRVGHWSSPRTDNHFWLRIMMADILPTLGEAMASRLLRKLESGALLNPRWIDVVVTPDDDESVLLGSFVARRLGTSATHVTVPRHVMKRLSAGELGEEAAEWVRRANSEHGENSNVIIVDQAAHHFRTYSAIKSLVDRAGWHCLAFAVAVDRTGISPELPHMMHDTRYASLYRWPFPPRLRLDCGCDV